jgi:hypothetical protein
VVTRLTRIVVVGVVGLEVVGAEFAVVGVAAGVVECDLVVVAVVAVVVAVAAAAAVGGGVVAAAVVVAVGVQRVRQQDHRL